jgi:hypothetical protein
MILKVILNIYNLIRIVMYPFLPLLTIKKFLPEIQRNQVSKRARSEGQFLSQYVKYGEDRLPLYWRIKRENFIKRHLSQYRVNKTLRRRLALITWAYDPED